MPQCDNECSTTAARGKPPCKQRPPPAAVSAALAAQGTLSTPHCGMLAAALLPRCPAAVGEDGWDGPVLRMYRRRARLLGAHDHEPQHGHQLSQRERLANGKDLALVGWEQ